MIQEISTDVFWDTDDVLLFEKVRKELRDVMQFIVEPGTGKQIFTRLADPVLDRQEGNALEAAYDFEDYRAKVNRYVNEHGDTLAIHKLKAVTADMFVSAVRKYTRARKLTPRMLNELVQRIEVYQAEKVDGVWVQRLTIHYNCVGAITIPENLPLPMPDITVNTRKGVYVSYQPDSKAG